MRPIWNGAISFGLLNVPVQLFSATRDIDLHFRLLDGRDKKPIRYERVNTDTGDEVPWKEIVKAYEVKKGNFLVVDEKELKRAAPEQTETIDIEAFVERCDIDPIYFEKPYFVAPGKKAEKGYHLLRQALADSGKVGIARVVIRTRQYLAAIVPEARALMLMLMRFQQEVVEPSSLGLHGKAPKVTAQELEMAKKLLESMSKKWDPEDYKDEFRTKLRQLLERKAKKGSMVKTEPKAEQKAEDEGAEVIDLVSLLQRSVKVSGKAAPHARRSGRTQRATARRRSAR